MRCALRLVPCCASADKQVSSAQVKEHRGAVLDLIDDYLKSERVYISLNTNRVLMPQLGESENILPFCRCVQAVLGAEGYSCEEGC